VAELKDGVVVDETAAMEHVNPADDARNDVAAAIKQLRGDGEPPASEAVTDDHPAPVAKEDHPTDPARYADGTFKKTKAEAAAEAAPADTNSPPADTAAKASVTASAPLDAPPAGWAAEGKQAWTALKAALPALPPEVQASISAIHAAAVKREQDFNAGGQQWSEQKRRYEQTLSPLVAETQRLGIPPEEGLKQLLAAHRALNADPGRAIATLAQQYGVDLATLASNPPAPQAQRVEQAVPPEFVNKISTLENQLHGFLQSQTMGVIESFSSTHPHYAAVENEIAQIIPLVQQTEPGLAPAQVLEKAYERAIWLNPEVRAQLIAEQQAASDKARTDALKAKAAQATRAAVSVRGSSNGAMPPPKVQTGGDIYDDVRNAIAQLRQ
jgi:hypothetical protein